MNIRPVGVELFHAERQTGGGNRHAVISEVFATLPNPLKKIS